MKKEIIFTWILLLFLTIASAFVANYYTNGDYLVQIIILLAILKFIGIALNFMELKKAHIFWRMATIVFVVFFYIIILIVK